MKLLIKAYFLLVFLFPLNSQADILVMVHGYHSDGNSWRYEGIVQLLTTRQWQDAGQYVPVAGGVFQHGPEMDNTGSYTVTVELPSEAPVELQADLLDLYLRTLAIRYPEQKIRIVAHSAGGIVARLALVKDHSLPVIQLITIATPHLGTGMAEVGELLADSPMGFFAPLFGADEINRSEHLYSQLGREYDNYFLFWLNRQPHPPIDYVSIVRGEGSFLSGDIMVPSYSQDMANVPAIGPGSRLFLTPGDHSLKFADGIMLTAILSQ